MRGYESEYFPIGNLRHAFATRVHEAGTSPVTVTQMLGHASTGVFQTYAKVLDEYRRDAVKKLEEYQQSKVVDETSQPVIDDRVN
jgi:site-specific recombinase XerD